MFRIKGIVKLSGKGRPAIWPARIGTVTAVTMASVFVQWRDCAVEGPGVLAKECETIHVYCLKVLDAVSTYEAERFVEEMADMFRRREEGEAVVAEGHHDALAIKQGASNPPASPWRCGRLPRCPRRGPD